MAPTMKGRHTLRASTPSGRAVRYVEPWRFEAKKKGSTLHRLEKAYLDALEAVDLIEIRKATAQKSGTLTPSGVVADTLQFAASKPAPQLQKAKRAVEQAKAEAADRRAKLVLKAADKTYTAGQMRRLWKLDKFNAMSDSERNAYLAKAGDNLDPELQ
jgi:ribosomal protein L12E/L44/L45/RPP1/RPP2